MTMRVYKYITVTDHEPQQKKFHIKSKPDVQCQHPPIRLLASSGLEALKSNHKIFSKIII